jgi:uncharacterized membrane protein YsdA (DUF1294 family)
MFEAVALYIMGINAGAFAAFWLDKRAAQRGLWRTPESTLLMFALIGGAPGAIAGQQLFRHKTRKEPFRTLLWLIASAQSALLIVIEIQRAR